MVAALFRISVYDGDRKFLCQIGSPSELSVTVRENLVGTLTMTLPMSHRRIPELMREDARLKVKFRGEHLISGPITEWEGQVNGKSDYLTVTVEDDFRILREILGWPAPTAGITDQGYREYKTYTGNAETIVKTVVTDNALYRLDWPGLTIAPDLGRGAVIPGGVPFRMHPLADKLFPAVEDAGLGVTIQQQGSNLVLDVREPVTHQKLSIRGGTVKDVQWRRTRAKAVRAVVGGPGEGVERQFRSTTDAALEALYRTRAEVFQDARDAKDDAETGETAEGIMAARGAEALAENAPKHGISVTLTGSGIFQYGPGGFHVGDKAPVEIAPGVVVTQPIRECTLNWVSPYHASAVPTLGEITDKPITAALARATRDQEKR